MSKPVAVITGAARGIGRETARHLAADHRVALLDLDGDGAKAAASDLPDAVWAHCDIADADAVRAAVVRVVAQCGGIDVCISNAGVATAGSLRLIDADVVAAQVNVNLVGNWRFIRAWLPHVIERRGYVLGVASLAALVGSPGIGAYAASKAGLERLLDVLRIEVRHLGVDVGIAYFSWIETEMVRGTERHHPGFAQMRTRLRGPLSRTLSMSAAGAAMARTVRERRRIVTAPRFVAGVYRLRGVIGELTEREGARHAAEVDRYTAELVAQRGTFEAGLRPDEPASLAAARSAGH